MNSILDDQNKIVDIDTEGMCKIVDRFPEQCQDAINISRSLTIPKKIKIANQSYLKYGDPKNILVVGMGGSAIGGDLLKDWLRDSLPIPIEVCRTHHLPAYVDENTLVLAVSYSGNTVETLNAYLDAIKRKCMTFAFTSGGLLLEFSTKLGVPVLKLPTGYPPRSAIAYLFFPLISVLDKLKLINRIEGEVNEAITVVTKIRDEINPEVPVSRNLSKTIATEMGGHIPCVCGFDFFESVALRMKTQFNENSKILAKVESFPELNHNVVVGWVGQKDLTSNFFVILLRDEQETEEMRTRIDTTKKLVFEMSGSKVFEIRAKGKGRLAKMLSTMYVGDFASIYLAILRRVNPTPVSIIDKLKGYLEQKANKSEELRNVFEGVMAV